MIGEGSAEDFRTPASQTSETHHSIDVMISHSAGSQPLDNSDSTVDIGCSPVKNNTNNRLESSGAGGDRSPTQFASDATTTDGWCTPSKSPNESSAICPRGQSLSVGDDRSVITVQSLTTSCLELTDNISASSSNSHPVSDAHRVRVRSSAPDAAANPRGMLGLEFRDDDIRSSTGSAYRSGSSLGRDASSSSTSNDVGTDHREVNDKVYEADVDSDTDDVISLCVGRAVRRRRMRNPPLIILSSSSSDSDQSEPLLGRSRDHRGKDGVAGPEVTTLSSGGESDDGLQPQCSETDYQCDFISAVERSRSPVLFSESSP